MSKQYFIPLNWLISLIVVFITMRFNQYWLSVVWGIVELLAGLDAFRFGLFPVWLLNLFWSWGNMFVWGGLYIIAPVVWYAAPFVGLPSWPTAYIFAGYAIAHQIGWLIPNWQYLRRM